MLSGKNVLLAVTGSIAAYKSAFLVREFIKNGAFVKVIVTEAALQFVTTVTLSTLSKNPVYKDFTSPSEWPCPTNNILKIINSLNRSKLNRGVFFSNC